MKKILLFSLVTLLSITVIYFNQDRTNVYIQIKELKKLNTQYIYSENNDLVKIKSDNINIDYDFDKFNRRVVKKVNNKIKEKYVWLENNKILAILDKDDSILQTYNYKNKNDTLPFGMEQNGKKYYFIFNKMKSLKVVIDKTQNIVKVLKYDINGNIIFDSNPSLSVAIGYAGGIYDNNSKLLHFKEGIYNPIVAKWLTKIDGHDIIQNLKELNETNNNDVYKCSATLDVYYHSYLCAGQQCGGLYANDYLNYFKGTGEIIDNSNYFNKNICTKIQPNYKKSNQIIFAKCVNTKIQPRVAKLFDALRYNCHHEVKNIIETCSKQALPKGLL